MHFKLRVLLTPLSLFEVSFIEVRVKTKQQILDCGDLYLRTSPVGRGSCTCSYL